MTTDNRTNEPTEAQVEAAAVALMREIIRLRTAWGTKTGAVAAAPWIDENALASAALVGAAGAVPAAQQVSESEALALVEDVIAIHADRIGTHYEDCYKYHVACLAVAVKHRLAGKEKNE